MFVSDILSQKGGLVFSVTPGTTVAEVAKQLSVRRIGSVLVLNDHSSVSASFPNAIWCARSRPTAQGDGARGAASDDPRSRDLPSRRFDRRGHAGHDQRPLPPSPGAWITASC